MRRNFLRLLSAAVLTAGLPFSAHALDSRFTDNDGDMVADIPTDESQWVDPRVLIFTYTPVEDPALYARVWDGFVKHMSEVTGKPVRFFPVQSNAAQLEAMRSGRLHVAGFNTGSTPLAVNCVGFRPFTMMARADGSFGYEMEIIVPADSDIESLSDLRGRTVAFTAQTSNSGYKAPLVLLEAEAGLSDSDFNAAFSGAHDNSILGVVNRDYDAAAIANSVLKRMIARDVVKPDSYRTIYRSETFPTTAYGTVFNLHPDLQEKVREAFFSYDWTDSPLLEEFKNSGEAQFLPITYKEHWAVVRQIDEAMNTTYACN
ncbi:MAG: phosphate/phosphite/phosphonate ABC transporter substrate-binding protein [Thioalkalivibrionaceae bacterium]